jgi:hypothetical protein
MLNHRHVGAWAGTYRGWNRWGDYVLDLAGLRRFLVRLDALRASPLTGRFLECIYVIGIGRRPDRTAFAFEASGRRPGAIEFLLGVYYMVPAGDASSLPAVEEELRDLLAGCVAAGGRPYLHGWNALTDDQIARLYGDERDALLRLRSELDPAAVLPLPFGTRAVRR